jgi:hypothetical protein
MVSVGHRREHGQRGWSLGAVVCLSIHPTIESNISLHYTAAVVSLPPAFYWANNDNKTEFDTASAWFSIGRGNLRLWRQVDEPGPIKIFRCERVSLKPPKIQHSQHHFSCLSQSSVVVVARRLVSVSPNPSCLWWWYRSDFSPTKRDMSSNYLQELSPNAEVVSKQQALRVNVAAAIGLQNVLKSNLGPTGTLKLLVGGAGQLKLTKDGLTLLREMQIQHPTAALIARTATAQDDVTGDGTTSTVLLTGELLKQAEKYVLDSSIHPRILTDGLDLARDAALEFLAREEFTRKHPNAIQDRELLMQTARTSLGTKLDSSLVPKVRFPE